ncbi:hypothetical protein IAR50_006925 [Cryptococcus sp. DSM 104548]
MSDKDLQRQFEQLSVSADPPDQQQQQSNASQHNPSSYGGGGNPAGNTQTTAGGQYTGFDNNWNTLEVDPNATYASTTSGTASHAHYVPPY